MIGIMGESIGRLVSLEGPTLIYYINSLSLK